MDKNINFVLLAIIVMVLCAFAGATLYYQKSYSTLSDRYHEKLTEANTLSNKLNFFVNLSTKLNTTIVSKSTDIADLSGQYITEKNQREEVEKNLNDTQLELESKSSLLENTKKELSTTKSSLTKMTTNYNNAKSDLNSLNTTFGNFKSSVNSGIDDALSDVSDLIEEIENMIDANNSCSDDFDDTYTYAKRVRSEINSLDELT